MNSVLITARLILTWENDDGTSTRMVHKLDTKTLTCTAKTEADGFGKQYTELGLTARLLDSTTVALKNDYRMEAYDMERIKRERFATMYGRAGAFYKIKKVSELEAQKSSNPEKPDNKELEQFVAGIEKELESV